MLGELPGQLEADTARCARDDCDGPSGDLIRLNTSSPMLLDNRECE
jgi:hypothetical protein